MNYTLRKAYDFNLRYAHALVVDIDGPMMTRPGPQGLENHPAFTLGHLCSGAMLMVRSLGGTAVMPEGWDSLFLRKGPGDPRTPESSVKYPSKSELLEELTRLHGMVRELIGTKSEKDWQEPVKWRFSDDLPTLADLTWFMCVTHENMHLGQLPAWRRHFGYPSALAGL